MIDGSFIKTLKALIVPENKVEPVESFPGLFFHTGVQFQDYEEHLAHPRSIKQHTYHGDVASFCRYLARFKAAPVAVFADPSALTLKAFLDYHLDEQPEWCRHTAGYTLEPTRAFERWLEIDGNLLGQVAMANFIEENAEVITSPDAAAMLDLAERFSIKRDVNFASRVDRRGGTLSLSYEEEDQPKGKIDIPAEVVIHLRTYEGTDPADIRLRFRYRMREGKLVLGFKILDLDLLQEALFDAALATVREAVGEASVFIGSAS